MARFLTAAQTARATAGVPLLLALSMVGCGDGHTSRTAPRVPPEASAGAAGSAGGSASAAGGGSDGGGIAGDDPNAEHPLDVAPETRDALNLDANGIAFNDVLGQRVMALLEQRCGSCHSDLPGAAAVRLTAAGQLFSTGLADPNDSAGSPLVVRGTERGHNGSIQGNVLLTTGEVALLRRFIEDALTEPRPCTPVAFIDSDASLALMASDIASLPEADRRFARYATLAYASNAGVCGDALERERSALRLALNATSLAPSVALPQAIDADGLIYRIDLRDYGWARAIDLDGDGPLGELDAWSAIVGAAGVYAVEYAGPEADALITATGAAVPFLPANAFLHSIAGGDLYYSLIGAPRLPDFWLGLGIDIDLSIEDRAVVIAGFGVARRETEVIRVTDPAERPVWSIADSDPFDSESPYSNPTGLFDATPQFILRLPNGLQAFLAQDDLGQRQASAGPHDNCAGSSCATLPIVACSACHDRGLLPLTDDVRRTLVGNGDTVFPPQELALALQMHPPQPDLDARLAADGAVDTLARAPLLAGAPGPNPLSQLYFGFERNRLADTQAAAELGVSIEQLHASVPENDPELSPLGDYGTMERSAFEQVLGAARCRLQAGTRNRPRCADDTGANGDAGAP